MWWVILGVTVWVGCAIPAYGLFFAYFQRAYPYCCFSDWGKDFRLSLVMSFGGPVALFVAAGATNMGKHGFKWGWETCNIDKDAVGLMKLLFLIKSESMPNVYWISQKMGRPIEWVIEGMLILAKRQLIPWPRLY